MLLFKRLLIVGCVGTLVIIGLMATPLVMDSRAANLTTMARPNTASAETNETIQLPEWLLRLDLNETQIRQLFEIDALLEQRIQLTLTERQYSQWQSSQALLSNQSWNFEDLNIDLSPYQQIAIDESFHLAMQSLIDMLSLDQKQQLMQYLSDENIIPESSFETDVEI